MNDQNWIKDKTTNLVDNIESDHELFNEISKKLAYNIQNIIRNEIVKNLQMLKNNVTQKLKQTSTLMKEMIDSACNAQLEACNDINKNIKNIANDVEILHKRQQLTEKQYLFAKMMEDASSQFSLLHKSQEEHYSFVTDKCNYVSKVCSDTADYSTDSYNKSVTMQNNLKEHIQSNLEKIETDIVLKTREVIFVYCL